MKLLPIYLFLIITLISCQPVSSDSLPTLAPTIRVNRQVTPNMTHNKEATEMPFPPTIILSPTTERISTATVTPSPSPQPATPTKSLLEKVDPTSTPLATVEPIPTLEPTATFWPTVTRQILSKDERAGLVSCSNRVVSADLLFVVTQQFPLPESYAPADLVALADYFESSVTLDQSLYTRQILIEPLLQMLAEMNEAGLRPSIISAYRSAQEQAMAWKWWGSQYPGRVAIMSARPGYSEHQLGTTVDFGSPELNHLFHVDFANTKEGIWLTNNAHRYGFTMSYPSGSYDTTGFKYEPWHYRYVGNEMAQTLFDSGQILTSWQIENISPPCIP